MKYTGIVINSNVYKDNDLIIDLLTENEIITFRSKGIKKQEAKNRSLIFDFAFIEAEFYKKTDKYTLINGKNLYNYNLLYSSFEGLLFISFIKEILFKLVVDEDKILLFSDLKSALIDISKTNETTTILYKLTNLMLKTGVVSGFSPLEYYKESGMAEIISDFYELNDNIKKYDNNHILNLIKKIGYYLEETSDIKLNSISLLQHL